MNNSTIMQHEFCDLMTKLISKYAKSEPSHKSLRAKMSQKIRNYKTKVKKMALRKG